MALGRLYKDSVDSAHTPYRGSVSLCIDSTKTLPKSGALHSHSVQTLQTLQRLRTDSINTLHRLYTSSHRLHIESGQTSQRLCTLRLHSTQTADSAQTLHFRTDILQILHTTVCADSMQTLQRICTDSIHTSESMLYAHSMHTPYRLPTHSTNSGKIPQRPHVDSM